MLRWLKRWWDGPTPDYGLGQSAVGEARWAVRLRRARRLPIGWRRPTPDEARWWKEHPRFGRFADFCYAVATVDGRRWTVMERTWHGWPDPPEYVWFALEVDDAVWAAPDFDGWPRAWTPPGPPGQSR